MSRPLDVGLYPDQLALRVGHMVLKLWQYERQIEVLEQRVDELDPPAEGL